MKQLAVLGTEAFTLGFRLAGIRRSVNIHDPGERAALLDRLLELKEDREVGIVIVEERVMAALESDRREEIEESVSPVFITLSTEMELDSIRKLIIKSIGVDLWKGD